MWRLLYSPEPPDYQGDFCGARSTTLPRESHRSPRLGHHGGLLGYRKLYSPKILPTPTGRRSSTPQPIGRKMQKRLSVCSSSLPEGLRNWCLVVCLSQVRKPAHRASYGVRCTRDSVHRGRVAPSRPPSCVFIVRPHLSTSKAFL